ncbi:hypothetical protein [Antarcticirhabdus aurantiaca]|uniref:Uncharacterized protein n=1 Tax=Antarcticirhabdus aurantiaca TaxID=2606717 RepID=A0ACD4NUW6_9HYPH|nr:hypothetical protein [Antarcticirhabdus aurantiaca]WAJ30617.1 hypothetical protein OXU80_10595 [Jeongeuplla avenae]
MKNPLKRDPISAAETELKNLAQRRGVLADRQRDAVARLDAARSARKNALSSDPTADLSGLTRAVQEAGDEVDTIASVLSDLDEQVGEAEGRLAAAKDAEVRSRSAKQLEGIAKSFDQAAADLEAALAGVGKAYAAMVAAIPETLQVVEIDERVIPPEMSRSQNPDNVFSVQDVRQNALPNDLARVVLAEGLARVCPMAFGMKGHFGGWRFSLTRAGQLDSAWPSFSVSDFASMSEVHTAGEAAAKLVTDRLRDRARHIVAGDMSPNLDDAPIFRPKPEPKPIPQVQVYALEDFAFRTEADKLPTLIGKWWVHLVPENAADVAVAAGVALRTDTPEGAAAFEERKAIRARSSGGASGGYLSLSMCQDLGLIRAPAMDGDEPGPDAGGATVIPLGKAEAA